MVEIGIKGHQETFATPMMIALIEKATPEGMKVWADTEVTAIDAKR